MEKGKLREDMKQKLAALAKPLYEDKSFKIAQNLFKEPNWIEANTIGVTISVCPEVDTYQIIRKAWEQGKKVVVPKCDTGTRKMIFRELQNFSQLETVYFGLYEPIEQLTRKIDIDEIDLLIIPGLAYTRKGYRIGFGGGYYDRFLEDYHGPTLSLAFDDQIVSELPIENHDLPVAKIITNREVIDIND
jgi:5-formyltetrahydrofolate cyclo-ligase